MTKIVIAMLSAVAIASAAGDVAVHAAAPGARSPRVAQGQPAASVAAERALLDKYCVTCHNSRLKTAGLVLDEIDLTQIGRQGETWEKVVRKLRGKAMPPAGALQPDKAAHDQLVGWLEERLDSAAAANTPARRPV